MKKVVSFLILPLLFLTLVLFSNFSGNDKTPFLILFLLVIIALICIIAGVVTLINKKNDISRFLFLGAVSTLVYVVISIFLSRAGYVDSLTTIGFR